MDMEFKVLDKQNMGLRRNNSGWPTGEIQDGAKKADKKWFHCQGCNHLCSFMQIFISSNTFRTILEMHLFYIKLFPSVLLFERNAQVTI